MRTTILCPRSLICALNTNYKENYIKHGKKKQATQPTVDVAKTCYACFGQQRGLLSSSTTNCLPALVLKTATMGNSEACKLQANPRHHQLSLFKPGRERKERRQMGWDRKRTELHRGGQVNRPIYYSEQCLRDEIQNLCLAKYSNLTSNNLLFFTKDLL